MRDTSAAVKDAGVTVGSERGSLLPGSGEKPADVYAHDVVARFVRLTVSATIGEAQVAIRRSHAIQCSSTSPHTGWEVEVEDVPWARAFGVEPRIEMAADTTAHIVFDNNMNMLCM